MAKGVGNVGGRRADRTYAMLLHGSFQKRARSNAGPLREMNWWSMLGMSGAGEGVGEADFRFLSWARCSDLCLVRRAY